MTPARGKAFVRRIETPETLPGGTVLLTPTTREDLTAQQVELLAIGAPAYCTEADCERCHRLVGLAPYPEALTHPFDGKPHDWALVAPRALSPTDTDGLYVVAQDDVLAILTP